MPAPRVTLVALACAVAPLATAGAARADIPGSLVKTDGPEAVPPPPGSPADLDRPAERRAGVVIGLTIGVGLASASGYPNDVNLIGNPDYYAASGLLFGTGGNVYLMGAFTDYLSFGFWGGAAVFDSPHWHSTGQAGGLRLEIFPLYGLGGPFRDLGAFGEFGIGGTRLTYKDAHLLSSYGVSSFLGAGVFYEFLLAHALGGHFALGPSLEYDAIWSTPMERHGTLLGLRFLWYGGK